MENNRHTVYLALGANIGNKEKNIQDAIKNIDERIGKIIAVSAFHITKPQGFESQNMFINAACMLITELSPLQVLEYTQVIEREIGRKSKSDNGIYHDRLIDIDILLYDNLVLEYPHLLIPHPYMHKRDYVLAPLSEIAGAVEHPILHKTIDELKEEFTSHKR